MISFQFLLLVYSLQIVILCRLIRLSLGTKIKHLHLCQRSGAIFEAYYIEHIKNIRLLYLTINYRIFILPELYLSRWLRLPASTVSSRALSQKQKTLIAPKNEYHGYRYTLFGLVGIKNLIHF